MAGRPIQYFFSCMLSLSMYSYHLFDKFRIRIKVRGPFLPILSSATPLPNYFSVTVDRSVSQELAYLQRLATFKQIQPLLSDLFATVLQ